jgi:anti-anti-sigma factor
MRPDELKFTAETVRESGRVTIALGGELDIATLAELEAAVPAMAPGELLVLDLRDLLFLDSSSIHVLMRLDVASRAEGWTLVAVRARPDVQRVLDICHVSDRIRTVDSPDEA